MPATCKIFFKRNFIIELNMWLHTIIELLVLVVLLIIISLNPISQSRNHLDKQNSFDKTQKYVSSQLNSLDVFDALIDNKKYTLGYAPEVQFTKVLAEAVAQTLQLNGSIGFESEKALMTRFDDNKFIAGIVFKKLKRNEEVPRQLNVAIRYPSAFRTIKTDIPSDQNWATRCSGSLVKAYDNVNDNYADTDLYLREGFLPLQHQIFMEWYRRLKLLKPTDYEEPQVEMRMVKQSFLSDVCPLSGVYSLPTFLYNFIFLLPFLHLIWNLAQQQEDNVHVHDWFNGYSFCLQWSAHFLTAFVHFLILTLITWLMFFAIWIYTYSAELQIIPMLHLLMMLLLCTSGLILCAMVIAKSFPCKVNALLVGLIYWLANYAIFSIVIQRYWDVSGYYVFVAFFIFINNLIPFIFNVFQRVAQEQLTLHWRHYLMLYGSALGYILLHLIILIILQCQCPGRFISRRVLRRKKYDVGSESSEDRVVYMVARRPSWRNFEFGHVGSKEVMRLRGISTQHRYSERKIVKAITMRLYSGEIYVLLGHIGAGKVTLLRVICGMKLAHRGSIQLLGEDFYADLPYSRSKIDFRMLANGLPNYMTVRQTIKYFVATKTPKYNKDAIELEYKKWWEYLAPFIEREKKMVRHLNYGQRRLLSLCCCLAMNRTVIALNEPTQYLNANESIAYFNILEREKAQRVIIVSTCSIDDAQRIGNRIGIFNMGVLEASGTPFYLCNKFGGGFELVILKKPQISDEPITEFLQKYIPDIGPDNQIGDQLIYKISNDKDIKMQQLLIHIERERKNLGIDNIRVVGPDISDIYMKLVTSFRMQKQVIPDFTQTFKYGLVSKSDVRKQQIRAMLYKKIVHQAPNFWPIIMIVIAVVLIILISRLAHVLELSGEEGNTVNLGVGPKSMERSFLPDLENCDFIQIKHRNEEKSLAKASPQPLFRNDAMLCKQGSFQEYIQRTADVGVGAVDVSNKQLLIAWANQEVLHGAPITLNLLHNRLLQFSYPKDADILTTVENNPMPTRFWSRISVTDNQLTHMHHTLTLGIIMPMAISVLILPLVEENATHLRILQIIAGITLPIYWSISFCWDYITYLIYILLFIIIMSFASLEHFSIEDKLIVFLLLVIFGFAGILSVYLLSMFFKTGVLRAYLISLLLHLVFGLVLYVIYWEVANNNVVFFYLASISPGFALLDGVSHVYTHGQEKLICQMRCAAIKYCNNENMEKIVPMCRENSHFEWKEGSGVLASIVFMFLAAIAAVIAISCIELQRKERKHFTSKNMKQYRTESSPFDDADVVDVKMKIADADMHKCKQSAYLVDQLEAEIPPKAKTLRTISFSLSKYTSMGIYGPHKCGKSHLVRQLIGQDGFRFGEIYVRGLDLKYELDQVQSYIGYCPQKRGYLNNLTPSELMRLMFMIRGIPQTKIAEMINDLSQMLSMKGWLNRRMALLNEEKCRKVNVAVSLISYNKVIILDEPTWGMSATTRREIWNILRYIRYCGKTLIFTTYDELDAKVLADFIILFDNHEMLGIGSMQYMRSRYSNGFYLEIKLLRDGKSIEQVEENLRKDTENLNRFVKYLHEKSEMVVSRDNWFKFFVPVDHIIYSYLYGALEKNKTRLNIAEYRIYQASVKDIMATIQEQRSLYRRNQAEVPPNAGLSTQNAQYSTHNLRYSTQSETSNLSAKMFPEEDPQLKI